MNEFIGEGIFPAHEIHLTGGASGSGKTTLEAQFIEDWRNGRPVFGYKSYPAPFCYIACDRSLKSVKATLRRLAVPYDEWPLASLIDHGNAKNMAQIVKLARSLISTVEVIWLDGIHSLCPKGKINDYGVVQEFLVDATRTCQHEGITIKAMGHATKVREGENFLNPRHRFLGSVAWGGYSDTMTLIDQAKPDDPSDTTRLVHLLPRNEEGQLLKYEIIEGKLVQISDVGEMLLDRWLATLASGTAITTANVLSQGEKAKVSRASSYRWIKHACELGKLLKTGHGAFTVSFQQ